MDQPIQILYDQIINFFGVGQVSNRLKQVIDNGRLSRGIFIDTQKRKVRTPYAHVEDREIRLQATFLSFLWSMCYCMIAFQQMTIEQAEEDIIRLKHSTEANTVNSLFNWAVSLNEQYSDWPEDLPNPHNSGERIANTNALFFFAIRYLMYHEVGHLVLHASSVKFIQGNRRKPDLPMEDIRRFRQMELQADDYAIDNLIDANPDEKHVYMNLLGAAVAQLSSLFLLDDDDLRGGRTHPDFDVRLKRLAKKANFSEAVHTLFFDVTISIGIQVFFERFGVDYLPEDRSSWRLKDFSDLFAMLYHKVDERKALYNQYRPFIN